MVEVRAAQPTDVEAIRRLFNALIPTTTGTWRDHLASAEEMEGWFEARNAAGDPVLVAELDGAVVGYAAWIAFRGGPRFPGYDTTVEHTIHVDHAHAGRGIGRTLLEGLMLEAGRRNIHVLVAAIDSENVESLGFHRALGFTEVGRMPEVGRKFERWLELVLMQRIVAR